MVIIGEALAKQGYCRISLRKNIVARIDVENWAEILAQHFDKTLHEMLAHRPQTAADMLGISGVGQTKLDRYGDRFLSVLRGEATAPD